MSDWHSFGRQAALALQRTLVHAQLRDGAGQTLPWSHTVSRYSLNPWRSLVSGNDDELGRDGASRVNSRFRIRIPKKCGCGESLMYIERDESIG
jgi:hypothetical protein